MRLRLTIVATLAVGMLVSGAGAGLAFQGFGQSGDNAAVAQYGSGNQPERLGGSGNQPERFDTGDHGVRGQAERGQPERVLGVAPPIDLQPARQVEAGSSLPFTGFAAIPILLLGVSLLVAGLILHRNAPRGD